jgi:hypothetical protein
MDSWGHERRKRSDILLINFNPNYTMTMDKVGYVSINKRRQYIHTRLLGLGKQFYMMKDLKNNN